MLYYHYCILNFRFYHTHQANYCPGYRWQPYTTIWIAHVKDQREKQLRNLILPEEAYGNVLISYKKWFLNFFFFQYVLSCPQWYTKSQKDHCSSKNREKKLSVNICYNIDNWDLRDLWLFQKLLTKTITLSIS